MSVPQKNLTFAFGRFLSTDMKAHNAEISDQSLGKSCYVSSLFVALTVLFILKT